MNIHVIMHKMALKMGKLEKKFVIKRLITSFNHLSLFNDQVCFLYNKKTQIEY